MEPGRRPRLQSGGLERAGAPSCFFDDPSINRIPPQPAVLASAAAYHGMGHIENFNDVSQRTLGDFTGGLKDLATELPEVRAALIDAFATWVEKVDFDGYRIDTIKHVESDFWPVFAAATRKRLAAENKTNFLMFGEAFDGNDQLIGSYTLPGALDSVFYFSQHFTAFGNVFENAYDAKLAPGDAQIEAALGAAAHELRHHSRSLAASASRPPRRW